HFHTPPTSHIYPLSLHDALPICLEPADPGGDNAAGAHRVAWQLAIPAGLPDRLLARHPRELAEAVRAPDLLDRQELAGLEVVARSEEHTSELQSRSDLVCRLLLE